MKGKRFEELHSATLLAPKLPLANDLKWPVVTEMGVR
jgi:hypothetical protein